MTDQLGSPRVITNSVGDVVSRRDFMPFGEQLAPDGTYRTANLYSTGDNIRQKFTGYQKDEETNLDFAEARMYENRHGRFTAVDPLLASGKSANPQTFNRYIYVLNNPLVLNDPDGLQVGVASGKVYRKGHSFAIFRGDPYAGYRPVTRTINTTTTVNGVMHYATVTPNGWTIGGRVDNKKFAAAPAPVAAVTSSFENAAVRALTGRIVDGFSDGVIGTLKGIGNSPAVALNGVTFGIFNGGAQALYFQGSNPLAVPMIFGYNNAREASYGSAGSTGTLLGLGLIGPVFAGSSSLSITPQTFRFAQTTASTTFSAGGSFAGRGVLDVAADLRSGALSAQDVPVGYVTRNGVNLIDNTRSAIALQEAGVPMSEWNLVDRTTNPFFQQSVTDKLVRNGLTNSGTSSVRMGSCTYFCH